ncbi:cell division transmembrane protein FtsL (plasmid) [Legionella adelaidensis]|uniref:Cell division protein FtsL n=1 Tax=Legionella adelaidensis TaxID=45056 RepID=A0A0W0R500_9GAMM|nr:cell division protein FtsL [Legionella adelaidensis]KTC66106.1 cell division transmembrane protein FtsL [Legionella adelaidensis]VEH85824.1 cell division transmembrane protein FtsL [Legionella adelaidensis]
MNAAAKVINQSNFFTGHWAQIRVSKRLCMQIILIISVLLSALAVIYITNLHRITFSQLQSAEQQTHQLQLQWGQLLLEQASLATPARVQELATEKLHMVIPSDKQAFILRLR